MSGKTKKIIVDVDDTLTVHGSSGNYREKEPREEMIQKMKHFREMGYEIILYSARNMRTYNGDIAKININTLPVLVEWLEKHNVEYDGLIMGKPWCGEEGFYIDDKTIRPDEFIRMSEEEIQKTIGNQ